MPFHIFQTGPNLTPERFGDSQFESADHALIWIANNQPIPPFTKLSPRRVASFDLSWIEREKEKFLDGSYTRPIWAKETWFHSRNLFHFCRLSTEESGKIAYTEESNGRVRHVRMTPGRYLTQFYSHCLSRVEIDYWARIFALEANADPQVQIFSDSRQIIHAYQNGHESCMSYRASDYNSAPIHPLECYHESDLKLAVLIDENGPAYSPDNKNWRVTARGFFWPEAKSYWRIYPEDGSARERLEGFFLSQGFTKKRFRNARIRQIMSGNHGVVVPYIDGIDSVEADGDWLILDQGSISANSTGGLQPLVVGESCERCGETVPEDDTDSVSCLYGETESWCENCRENYSWYSETEERTYSDRVPHVELANGETVSHQYHEENGFHCGECNENCLDDDLGGQNEDDESICDSCALNLHEHSDGIFRDTEESTDNAASYHSTSPDQLSIEGV